MGESYFPEPETGRRLCCQPVRVVRGDHVPNRGGDGSLPPPLLLRGGGGGGHQGLGEHVAGGDGGAAGGDLVSERGIFN